LLYYGVKAFSCKATDSNLLVLLILCTTLFANRSLQSYTHVRAHGLCVFILKLLYEQPTNSVTDKDHW